jgi:hypothetical protein
MFNCVLCDSQEWTNIGLCTKCAEIGKIIACYDSETILKTLQTVYLRDIEKCEKKADVEADGVKTRSKKKSDDKINGNV